MTKRSDMQSFLATDGTNWGVDVVLPGASQALILFHHPDGHTARKDRYAWLNWHGPQASRQNTRLDLDTVRAALDDRLIHSLFLRSMLVGNGRAPSFSAA